jgi:hypothetical protein
MIFRDCCGWPADIVLVEIKTFSPDSKLPLISANEFSEVFGIITVPSALIKYFTNIADAFSLSGGHPPIESQ